MAKKKTAAATKKAPAKNTTPKTFLGAFNKWNHSKFGEKPTSPKKYANPKFEVFTDYYDSKGDDALRVIEVDTLDIVAQWKDIKHDFALFKQISEDTDSDVYNAFLGFQIKQGNHYVVAHSDWEGSDAEMVIRVLS